MKKIHQILKITAENPYCDTVFLLLLFLAELALCTLIVMKVPYTEIDWTAYNQQVNLFLGGERDYLQIRGNTGPLVYPAGFLYLYSGIQYVVTNANTHDFNHTESIRNAQWMFMIFYLMTFGIMASLYTVMARRFAKKDVILIWSWRVAIALLCLSKRMHSIFLLRLFNDGIAMLLCYISLALFCLEYFKLGSMFFSLGVSIKMNVLLYAPGLLLVYCQSGTLWFVVCCLAICAFFQVLLGAPFLLQFPISYIRKAFEFDRVFMYKWTVNWKFLSEEDFLRKDFSFLLLALHLSFLILFLIKWLKAVKKQTGSYHMFPTQTTLTPEYILLTLFTSNYIGIVFARTLHYQFYSWYFHTVPFILWISMTTWRKLNSTLTIVCSFLNILICAMMEYAFLVFPATPLSSFSLQCAHFIGLIMLWNIDLHSIQILKNNETFNVKED